MHPELTTAASGIVVTILVIYLYDLTLTLLLVPAVPHLGFFVCEPSMMLDASPFSDVLAWAL